MSKTIDEKVVSMQFDNAQFEKNVSTTMSTLQKLKQALHLDGASKGLSELNMEAKNNNFGVLGASVEKVGMKFSGLWTIADQTLRNITNSVESTAKRVAAAFTIDPIKTGFSEYELKMGSVQTIMASTGEDLETVNKYLQELNEYSDQTIYSFSDMTQNIGKFTNAGVKLEDAVLAMKGISNEAALSGANANEASRAMYNLSQALSMGYVQYIDWKSIENANMATMGFKEQLLKTAVAMKVVKKTTDGYVTSTGEAYNMQAMFKDGMKDQWLTSEVLIETLKDYADTNTEIGKKASEAATQVKTFSMMMDTLKAAAQSGWAQTWELIFGDFYEGRDLWTELSNTFGDIIGKSAEARNSLLEGALSGNSKWSDFSKQIEDAGISMEDFQSMLVATAKEHGVALDKMIEEEGSLVKALSKVSNAKELVSKTFDKFIGKGKGVSKTTEQLNQDLGKFQKIVDQVINGDLGNGVDRIKALTDAEYDAALVQKLVNKIYERNGYTWKNTTLKVEDLAEAMGELSDNELRNMGYTDEQIKKLKALQTQMNGMTTEEFLAQFEKPTGRELIVDTIRNSIQALLKLLGTVKAAWRDVFPATTASQLYNIIEAINKFSKHLIMSDETAKKLRRTLAGVFSIFGIITDTITTLVKHGLKGLSMLFGDLDIDILEFTASIGDSIVEFRKWLKENNVIIKGIDALVEILFICGEKIRDLASSFAELTGIDKFFINIKEFMHELKNINLREIGRYVVEGFKLGIADGFRSILDSVIAICKGVIDAFKTAFDIHSPSKVMYVLGAFVIAGLLLAFKDGIPDIINAIKNIGTTMFNAFRDFDWSKIFAGGEDNVFVVLKNKFVKIFSNLKNSLVEMFANFYLKYGDDISNAFEFIGNIFKSLFTFITGSEEISLDAISETAKKILAVIVLFKVLNILNNVTGSIGAIGEGIQDIAAGIKWNAMSAAFKGMAIALAGLTVCMIMISTMEPEEAMRSAGILAGFLVVMTGLIALLSVLSSKLNIQTDMLRVAGSLLAMIIALALLIKLVKELDATSLEHPLQSVGIVIALLGALALSVVLVGKLCGSSVLKSAAAIITMVTALKMVLSVLEDYANYDWKSVGSAVPKMIGMLFALSLALRIAGSGTEGIGSALLIIAMVISIKMILSAIKELSEMDPDKMWQGILGVLAVLGGMGLMLALINKTNGKAAILDKGQKTANSFTGLATALLATTAAIWLLGRMDTNTLLKGGAAVIVILGMFSLLMKEMGKTSGVKTGAVLGMFIGMAIIIAEIATIIKLMSSIPWQSSLSSVASLSIFLIAMTGCLVSISKNDVKAKNIYKWMDALTSLGLIMAALAIVVGLLGKFGGNPATTIANVAALSILIETMTHVLMTLMKHSTIKEANISKWVDALFNVAGIITVLAIIIGLMNNFGGDPANSVANATALSVLIEAMSLALMTLMEHSSVKAENVSKWVKAMYTMIPAVVALALIVGLLGKFGGDPAATLASVTSLSLLLVAMAGVMQICSTFGHSASAAIKGAGALGVVLGVFGVVVTAIGALFKEFDSLGPALDTGVQVMGKLGQAIGQFIGGIMGGIIGGVLEGISAALPQLGSDLSGFMGKAQGFFDGLSGITAGMVAQALALVAVIAVFEAMSFINGIMNILSVGHSLPTLGKDLGDFMINALPFIIGLTVIPTSAVEGMKTLSEALLYLGAAQFLNCITNLLSFGKSDLGAFGEQLVEFGKGMVKFSKTITKDGGINEGAVTAAAEAGKLLASLYDVIPRQGGLWQQWAGVKDLGVFGDQIKAFGEAIIEFSNLMVDKGQNVTKELAQRATDAGTILASLYDVIPRQGGRWQEWIGEKDLEVFGNQITAFGEAIIEFSDKIAKDGKNVTAAIAQRAADAGTILASLYGVIPAQGGYWQSWAGVTDLEVFGDQITAFGKAIIEFSDLMVNDGANVSEATAQKAVDAAMVVVGLANALPETDGLWDKIGKFFTGGQMSMSELGNQLSAFGVAISQFATATSGIKVGQTEEVNNLVRSMIDIMDELVDLNISGTSKFKEGLKNLTDSKISDFTEKFSSRGLKNSVGYIEDLIDLINSMATLNSSGVGTFKKALSELGTIEVDNLVKAFTDSAARMSQAGTKMMEGLIKGCKSKESAIKDAAIYLAKSMVNAFNKKSTEFTKAGKALVVKFANGLNSQKSKIMATAGSVISSASNGIRRNYTSFYSAGRYLGSGLVIGINSQKQAVYNAAYSLGQKAVQGEKEGQQSNSPSKATIQAGHWLGEGLVIGMNEMGKAVYNSGKVMGADAVDSISNALTNIPDLANADLNLSPTITPVVDMSNVQAAKLNISTNIDTLLSKPVDALSQIMSDTQAKIEASNNRVTDAINSLRADLNSLYDMVDAKDTNLYIDSKRMASSLAKPMNQELNNLSRRGAY